MSSSRASLKLSFQAKVLIPVMMAMALFLAGTMWLVNNRITDQLQKETEALLSAAQTQFTNSLQTYSDNLVRQFRTIPEGPDFFPLAGKFQNPSDDKKIAAETMRRELADILSKQSSGIVGVIFSGSEGQFEAAADRGHRDNLNQIQALCAPSIKSVAENRDPEVHYFSSDSQLLGAVIVPSIQESSGDLLGTLVFLAKMDNDAARQLKSPDSEVAIIAGGQVAASTIASTDSHAALLREFNDLGHAASKGGIAPKAELTLHDGHYGARRGQFPTEGNGADAGYLLLVSKERALTALRDEQRTLLLCSLLGMAFSSFIVWALVRRVTQPLRQLRDSAEAVGSGDFSHRIAIQSTDELGELAAVFNRMTENLQKSTSQLEKTVEILRTTQAQLIHSEKLSAVGEFVAGVAHELNNPLTSLIGFAELLQATAKDDSARSSLKRVANSADRCHKIVQSLLSFARQRPPERKLTNINSVVDSVVDILIYELRTNNIQVTKELCPNLPRLLVDPHQLQQVFLNIVNNARQAIEAHRSHGSIHIITGSAGARVWVRFQDDGPGISKENQAKIFNPFFTTKPVGKGTGLGLSLSYGIIQEHGGSIAVESELDQGTIFIIDLPVTADAGTSVPDESPAQPTPVLSGKGKSILVVDDEEDILELIQETLSPQGYDIQTALDGAVALKKLGSMQFDLIVSDWKMPGINGQQLYQRLLEVNPAATKRMIFMTGDVLSVKTEKFLEEHGKICLTKPFSLADFQREIARLLQERN